MTITTFEKSDFTWYEVSILQSKQGYDIFLLFKDLENGNKFFNLITKDNKHPSFYCILQPDKTHVFKIDFSGKEKEDDWIAVSSTRTVESYPPLKWLQEDKEFRIIIGTEVLSNGIKQVAGTAMNFVPEKVEYLSEPEQPLLDQERLN